MPLPAPTVLPLAAGTDSTRLAAVHESLVRRFNESNLSTATDPKHDAVFGSAMYAVRLLTELMRIGNAQSILGRLGLRTLLETYINLRFLVQADKPELWYAFREYGVGQAKLSFLKFDEQGSGAGGFVAIDTVRALANEDGWQEFQNIGLGHWSDSNLRLLSEKAGAKADYDYFYPWTSAFVHANWAGVRNATFVLCGNPLHRLHRILAARGPTLEDVIADAATVVDKILELVDRVYQPYHDRVSTGAAKEPT
jgi:hypothetical protein